MKKFASVIYVAEERPKNTEPFLVASKTIEEHVQTNETVTIGVYELKEILEVKTSIETRKIR